MSESVVKNSHVISNHNLKYIHVQQILFDHNKTRKIVTKEG